jgi:hypothetical protein
MRSTYRSPPRRNDNRLVFAEASATVSALTSSAMPAPYATTLPTPATTPSRAVVLNTVAMNSPMVQPIEATA